MTGLLRQATCATCRRHVHLVRSPATGRTLTLDDPATLDAIHLCTSGQPVAVIDIDGPSARIRALNGADAEVRAAAGRFDILAIAVPSVAAKLATRGIRVLTADASGPAAERRDAHRHGEVPGPERQAQQDEVHAAGVDAERGQEEAYG